MEEIWALQAEFERAQEAEVVQRLSERNCVEIILKLIESGRIKLIFSSTGKEFLTPSRLRGEILSEIRSHGGRISITDLPDLLNVDLANIERAASEITSGSSTFLVNGQLISKSYVDSICNEIVESVLESGMVTLASLSQQFALPVGLLQSELGARLQPLGQKFNCQLNLQNQKLYTDLYATTHNAKIRGLLLGSTRPISFQSLISEHGLQEKLVRAFIQEMDGKLPGTVSTGANALGMFTPWVYIRAQQEHISLLYNQNKYVEISKLYSTGLSKPPQLLSELFPDGILLQRIFISPLLLQSVEEAILNALTSNSVLDARAVLPSTLSPDDVSSIIKRAEDSVTLRKASKQYHHLDKVFIVPSTFVKACTTSLDAVVVELGTQAAISMHQKGKPTITADDGADVKISRSKNDRSKKRSGSNTDALSRHIRPSLDLGIIKNSLTSAFPDCDVAVINGILPLITPTLRNQFDKIRDSPHIINDSSQDGVNISELRRKQIKNWIQVIQNLSEHFQAFSAANNELANIMDDSPLEQYLIKTTGLEMCDGLLRLNVYLTHLDYADEDKSALDNEQRNKLMSMVPSSDSESLISLASLQSSSAFFMQYQSLAIRSDVQIKDVPKKKLKQIGFSMKSRLAHQLSTEQRPEAVLLSAIILIFYRVIGMILHAPFSCVDDLIETLSTTKISKEIVEQLRDLKQEIDNPSDRLSICIESVRTIIASDTKPQE